MIKKIPALIITIVLSACAGIPANAPAPETLPTPVKPPTTNCNPSSSWTIQFNRSGGFAGFNESMTLDNGGRLKVQSERPPIDQEKTISEEQVEAIANLLVQACPFEVSAVKGVCADCFVYDLKIQMDEQKYSVQATDGTLTEELQPLISTLSQLLQGTE